MKYLLNEAIQKISDLEDKKPFKVNVSGKWSTTVATRVSIFREVFGSDVNIVTEILSADLDRVCMKATIFIYQNGNWEQIATGFAEEFRGVGMVNKTSALENCETSAIGRALANLGIHGGEYASAFEVDNAINNKAPAPEPTKYTLVSAEGEEMGIFVGEDPLVKKLREKLGVEDPQDEHKDFFKANKEVILKASEIANGSSKTALSKLLGIYNA